jgi:hypothetical protein
VSKASRVAGGLPRNLYRSARAFLIAASVLSVNSAAAARDDERLPAADVIFDRAAQAVLRSSYPRFASYVVAVSFKKGSTRVLDEWQTHEDLNHKVVYARTFSRVEVAHPETPHGINVGVPFFGNLNPVKARDPIGEVAFAVDQTYGLAPAASFRVTHDAHAFSGVASSLPVIGTTGVRARAYDVTLLGLETADDHAWYHLGLRPVRDPDRNRLRELWVDTASWLPKVAIVAGIGNRPPISKSPWRVTFVEEQGGVYIQEEQALKVLDYGGQGTLTETRVAFHELELSNTFPLKYAIGFSSGDPQHDP